jgi:hypothetical protein
MRQTLKNIFALCVVGVALSACTGHQPAPAANTTIYSQAEPGVATVQQQADRCANHPKGPRAVEICRINAAERAAAFNGAAAYSDYRYFGTDTYPVERPFIAWGNINYNGQTQTGCLWVQRWYVMQPNGVQILEPRVVGAFPLMGQAECNINSLGGVTAAVADFKLDFIKLLGGRGPVGYHPW